MTHSASSPNDVANYVFPKTWPANREQRAPIIGEWLSAEAVSSSLRLSFQNDTPSPRFPPWTVDEYRGISYVVRDANNFAVTYVYFESGPS